MLYYDFLARKIEKVMEKEGEYYENDIAEDAVKNIYDSIQTKEGKAELIQYLRDVHTYVADDLADLLEFISTIENFHELSFENLNQTFCLCYPNDYDIISIDVVFEDNDVTTLLERANMFEKLGYKNLEELYDNNIVNTVLKVDIESCFEIEMAIKNKDSDEYHLVSFTNYPERDGFSPERTFMLSKSENEILKNKIEEFLECTIEDYLRKNQSKKRNCEIER